MLLSNPPAIRNRSYIFQYSGKVLLSYGYFWDLRKHFIDELSIYRRRNSEKKSLYFDCGDSRNFKLTAGKARVSYRSVDGVAEVCLREEDQNDKEHCLDLEFIGTIDSASWNTLKRILDNGLDNSEVLQHSSENYTVDRYQKEIPFRIIMPPNTPFPRTTEFYADSMCRSAERLANCLISKSENLAKSVDSRTLELEESIESGAHYLNRQEYIEVDPALNDVAEVAKYATGAAASLITGAVSGVCFGVSWFGATFGSSIKDGAAYVVADVFKKDKQTVRQGIDGICDVAGGLMAATGTILSGVEQSARILGPSYARNIAKNVELKNGEDAGKLAANALGTAGNLASIGYTVRAIRPTLALKGTPVPNSQAVQQIKRQFDL